MTKQGSRTVFGHKRMRPFLVLFRYCLRERCFTFVTVFRFCSLTPVRGHAKIVHGGLSVLGTCMAACQRRFVQQLACFSDRFELSVSPLLHINKKRNVLFQAQDPCTWQTRKSFAR